MIKNNREPNYDIVIVGAGPSGLSSAIFAARAGFKVVVVERGKQAAPDPRGETLHEKPICTELFGEGFMKSLALNETAGRCYNSPNCERNFYIERSSPSIVFEWRKFIDRFVEVAERESVEIRTNSEVLEAIIEDGRFSTGFGIHIPEGQR
jgi:flavin-dependent dehydrogenase